MAVGRNLTDFLADGSLGVTRSGPAATEDEEGNASNNGERRNDGTDSDTSLCTAGETAGGRRRGGRVAARAGIGGGGGGLELGRGDVEARRVDVKVGEFDEGLSALISPIHLEINNMVVWRLTISAQA